MRSQSSLDKARIARSFSRSAETYDKFSGLQRTLANDLVKSVASVNISPKNILDIGTGTGSVAFLLHERYKEANIIGCDLAPGMIKKASQNNPHGNVTFEVADAESLPFEDKKFDLVASSTTFQWINDLAKAFSEAKRVLVPGGYFAFVTFGPKTLSELKRNYKIAFGEDAAYLHKFNNMREIQAMLKTSGFEALKLNSDTLREFYPDFRTFFKSLKGLGALNASPDLPKGLRSKAKMKALIKYYETNSRIGNQVYATFEVIRVLCRA
jgi:malonyl-CoA O-methyltransferase